MGILHRRGELDPLVLPQDDNYEKTLDDHQSLKMLLEERIMLSAVFEISLLLTLFILGWLKTGWNSLFYIALILLIFFSIIIVLYLVGKRATMSWWEKILGVIAIAIWLMIAWFMLQEKGI
jgi:hypothetical protein